MAAIFAAFAAVTIALKFTTFGDTNRSADDLFYLLVGQRMHEGLLPYVDVWDRKPLGLFLIYYLIAGISASVLPYQLIACLFTAASALVIALIVRPLGGWKGAVLAGLCFIASTVVSEGATGQAPDFYNLLIAIAALLLVRHDSELRRGAPGWGLWLAMALCGIAITIKQTSLFEALFFGAYVLTILHRAGVKGSRLAGVAAACAVIGALPMLAIAAFYAQAGHWHEFWTAMTTSNLVRGEAGGKGLRALGTVLRLAPLLLLAVWGLLGARADRSFKTFVAGWVVAAAIGFLAVPNFAAHYALALLVPLSVAAGLVLGQHRWGLLLAAGAAWYTSLWYSPASLARSRASAEAMARVAAAIGRQDSGGGLLVFDGPSYLYALSGKPFLSPLVFPHHLSSAIEANVSHLNTDAEIDRVLKAGPGVIVMAVKPYIYPINRYTRSRVIRYARAHCRTIEVIPLLDAGERTDFAVLGNCGPR